MKLVMAIIQDHIAQDILVELSNAGHRATKLSSTGGFFKKGNTTVLIGSEDEKVKEVKEIIENISKNKKQVNENTSNAIVFVLEMSNFIRV